MAKKIQEEDKIHEEWYEEAREMTLEKLPEFLKRLSEEYEHDYGTICHAIASSSIAAAWAMERTPQGGITGFQAGAIMWEFIWNWMTEYKGQPLRIINYDHMLYPQYEDDFTKISPSTWEYLKKTAKEKLEEYKGSTTVSEDVVKHMEEIVSGKIPFGYTISDE